MKVATPWGASLIREHRLDPARIIEAAENLARGVGERMPESSLAGLSVVLVRIARESDERARKARRPNYAIRLASLLAVGAGLLGLSFLMDHIHMRWKFGTITEVIQSTDAGFNLLILLAGALWFFVTLEARIKRRRALISINELREFAHVIDLTQLYYTPDLYRSDPAASRSSASLDYAYLLFCTQMLAVISNLAPLYTRGAAGDSILRAVFEVEMLANAITAKLLSKAETVRPAASANI
jgi:hypothetical protein